MARYAAGVGEGADVSASRGSHGANEGAFAPRGPAPGAAPWASDDDVDGAPPLTLLEEEDERTRSPARGDGRASAAGARSDAIRPQTLSTRDATANARRGGDRGETLNRAPFSPASGSDDEDVVDASPADAKRANRGLLGASSIVQNQSPEDAADREFLEETLGNAAAVARTASAAEASPQKERPLRKAKTKRPKRPAGLVIKKTAPSKSGLASLASLGALARGETATKENGATNENARGTRDTTRARETEEARREGRPEAPIGAGASDVRGARAARLELQEEGEGEEEEDDTTTRRRRRRRGRRWRRARRQRRCARRREGCRSRGGRRAVHRGRGGLSRGTDAAENQRGRRRMSAMARTPEGAGPAADDARRRLGGAGPCAAARARPHRHGSNAPSARLQRIMHLVRAAGAVSGHGRRRSGGRRGPASVDAPPGPRGLGPPLRVTLVGEGGAEAGLCLGEASARTTTTRRSRGARDATRTSTSSEAGAARRALGRPTESGPALRDAPRPARFWRWTGAPRELSLRGGSRVSVFPPWNEVEVPPSVATGFKRRRVVVGTLVAV